MSFYDLKNDKNKLAVIEYVDNVIEFYRGLPDADKYVEAYSKLKKNIEESLFSIVLVGEFSAGKSTFLNALMRKRILPSFTSETTATINYLRHKEKAPNNEEGIVYMNDGTQEVLEKLDTETISKVVSVKGGDKVKERIDHVDLFLDSAFLEEGVMLVDSPGLNGMEQVRDDLTHKQIKEAHACIFMFSADQPGSKTNFKFLEELKNDCNNIFFVLNKIDLIKHDEGQSVEEVINTIKKSYKDTFPQDKELPKIWPISSYNALVGRDSSIEKYNNEPITSDDFRSVLVEKSRMECFESNLMNYLCKGERARDQLVEPIRNLLLQLKHKKEVLEEQLQAIEDIDNTADLEERKLLLSEEINALEQAQKSRLTPIKREINAIINSVNNEIEDKANKISAQIMAEVETVETKDLLENYANNLNQIINTKLYKLLKKTDTNINDKFYEVITREFVEYFEEIESALDKKEDLEVSFGDKKCVLMEVMIDNKLEEYDKKIAECNQRKVEKEKELEGLAEQHLQAKFKEKEIRELKEEIKRLEGRYEEIVDLFIPLAKQSNTIQETVRRGREGILGGIAELLVGKKEVVVTKVIDNTEDIERHQKEHEQKLANIQQKIDKIKSKLEAKTGMDLTGYSSSELIELSIKKGAQISQNINDELQNLMREQSESLKNYSDNVMCMYKMNIKNYTDEKVEDAITDIKKFLKARKEVLSDIVNTYIGKAIADTLKERTQALEDIQKLLNDEGEQRTATIEFNKKAIDSINTLMSSGVDLEERLNNEMNMKVEQEVL